MPVFSSATAIGHVVQASTDRHFRRAERTTYCLALLLAAREHRASVVNTSLLTVAYDRGSMHHGEMARNRIPVETLKVPLWKRQPGETTIAYAAFAYYRDLPQSERSIARTSRDLKKNPTMLEDRARRWRWLERVDNWDAHLETVAVAAMEEKVAAMNARHAEIAFEGLRLVLQRLRGDDLAGVQGIDASKLGPQDLARLTEVLAKLERLAHSSATERVENTGAPVVIRLAGGLQNQNILSPEQGVGYVGPGSPGSTN
jgi:hypothetical protein